MPRSYSRLAVRRPPAPRPPLAETTFTRPAVAVTTTTSRRPVWAGLLMAGLAGYLLPSVASGQEAPEGWWAVLDTASRGLTVLTLDSLYTVRGTTPGSINRELERKGPRHDGRPFHGYHRARWRWRYTTDRTAAGTCRVTDFRIVVRSVITLPQLASDLQVAPSLRDAWDRYLAGLRRHEEGHRQIAVRALRRFQARASTARSRPCRTFQVFFDGMTAEASARIERAQADYDRETGYGRSQGAVWPPPRGTHGKEARGVPIPRRPGARHDAAREVHRPWKGR